MADKTTLTGAVIASTTNDLILTTGSLEYSNLKDKDETFTGGITSNESADSQSAGVNYGFTDSRQTNYATIGEGVIIVRPSTGSGTGLEGLNRDVTVSQYGTLDVGLEGGFTVDTATVNLIIKPVDTVVNTTNQVVKGSLIVYSITEGAVKAAALLTDTEATENSEAKEGLGVLGTIEAVVNAREDVLTIVAIADNKALAEKIDNATEKSVESLDGAANEVSGIVQTNDGVKKENISNVNLYQGSGVDNEMSGYAACFDQNTNETYLNTEETDISQGGQIIRSIFTEAQRKDNYDNDLGLDKDQQVTLAYSRGEQANTLWNRFSDTASIETNSDARSNWNSTNTGSSVLTNGIDKANIADTTGVVPLHFAKRPLVGSPWMIGSPLDDKLNTEILHEQIFFDDGTNKNIGFGPNARFPDSEIEILESYRHEEKYYDDDLMKKALNNVVDGKYKLIGESQNNCQDWADRARNEYQKLYEKLPDTEKVKVDNNVKKLEIKNNPYKELIINDFRELNIND